MAEEPSQLTRMERLLERTHDLVQEVAREQAHMSGVLDQMDKRVASLDTRMSGIETRFDGLRAVMEGRVDSLRGAADTRLDGLRVALDSKASTTLVISLITLLGAWSALLTALLRWFPGK